MASFLTPNTRMVRADHRTHLSAVLKTLQDAETRAEFRLVLPTLVHDRVPGEKQEFVTTHGCEGPLSLGNTPYSHRSWTAHGRAHPSPSNYKVQYLLVGAPRVGHVAQ